MKLRCRPINSVEAQILGPEHDDAKDMSDVVALVCDCSTLGEGHTAADILVHRYNNYEQLVAAIRYVIPFLGDKYPQLTLKKRLLASLAEAKEQKPDDTQTPVRPDR